MSEHESGIALTAKASAYLTCHPTPDAKRCGGCGRKQEACFARPCTTRREMCGVQ